MTIPWSIQWCKSWQCFPLCLTLTVNASRILCTMLYGFFLRARSIWYQERWWSWPFWLLQPPQNWNQLSTFDSQPDADIFQAKPGLIQIISTNYCTDKFFNILETHSQIQITKINWSSIMINWRLYQQKKVIWNQVNSWKPIEYNYPVSLFQQQPKFDYSPLFKESPKSIF